jgi:hypothetical protein
MGCPDQVSADLEAQAADDFPVSGWLGYLPGPWSSAFPSGERRADEALR